MYKGDYKWQHDYVRLAFDSGFYFEKHKSDNLDKNKISLIDIDRIIEERDFGTIERVIPNIVHFTLDQEQARILDASFVKTYRLSQLAIQYLLFCKKYLDNTLIVIKEDLKKVREENKELNLFVDDLKDHVANLMKQIDEKPTFKCAQCEKIFSTEDFLNSHIKRRHSAPLQEAETGKLQMEIKELKGRLNSAEKMIQREQNESKTDISKEVDAKKIDELQQRFEELRLQVQSELKILQTQHNFQEKYEKLFEKMTFQGFDKGGGGDLGRRRESTTQTDIEKDLELGSLNGVLVCKENDKENIPTLSRTPKRFEEALETKVTTSLQKIENQMESFWCKLNEMEKHQRTKSDEKPKPFVKPRGKLAKQSTSLENEVESRENDLSLHLAVESKKYAKKDFVMEDQELTCSSHKPDFEKNCDSKDSSSQEEKINSFSSKYDVDIKQGFTDSSVEDEKTNSSSLKRDIIKATKNSVANIKNANSKKSANSHIKVVEAQNQQTYKTKPVEKQPKIQLAEPKNDSTSSETIASEAEYTEESITPVSKPQPAPRKRPISSYTRKSKSRDAIDDDLLKRFRSEIEHVIKGRLQELGVSPEWKGLPTRSFERALEIVNHQANLAKKIHPNFDFISTQIEKTVEQKLAETKQQHPKKVIKPKTKKVEDKKYKSSTRGQIPSPQIEIKNRNMYETDSESENIKPTLMIKENLRQFSAPYSAVIEELKTKTTKINAPDGSPVKEEIVVKPESPTKGVLKSYPSAGSLTTKKVMFNLEQDVQRDLSVKDGGSSTSIASSVFDGTPTPRTDETKHKTKDIEDLSDFDFSDM